jgi:hypothetical protein
MSAWLSYDAATDERILNHITYDSANDQLSFFLADRRYPSNDSTQICAASFATDNINTTARSAIFGTPFAPAEPGVVDVSTNGGQSFEPILEVEIWDNNWCPYVAMRDANTVLVAMVDSDNQADPDELTIQNVLIERGPECQ